MSATLTFLESYVINKKIHIHFIQDYDGLCFCHLIYDLNKQKLEKLNKCQIYCDHIQYAHVLYHRSFSNLIFICFKEEPYNTKEYEAGGAYENLCCNVHGASDWKPYDKAMLNSLCDANFDAIIDIEDILFLFYLNEDGMATGCFDLFDKIMYKSQKILPQKTWYLTRWENNFVITVNGFAYYINTTHRDALESHKNMKISMYDAVPDELRLLREDRNDNILRGFIRRECDNTFNLNFPQYLTKIVLKYYSYFR